MLGRIVAIALAVFGLLAFPVAGSAQQYPSRTVTIIVPYPAGGPTDETARIVANFLSKKLGQNFIVENVTGGSTIIATGRVANAAPDGYTLLLGTNGTNATNVALYSKLPYSPLRDFAPITPVATSYLILLCHPSVPAASVRDLVALAKSKKGLLTYGSGGSGSTPHLAAELFKSLAHIELVHVPYKGGSPAMIDLLAGRIDLYFSNTAVAMPHVGSGRVRILAVTSAKREAALPNVPTFSESGVPGYEVTSWFGLFAPAKTPPEVIARLHADVARIVAQPETVKHFDAAGLAPASSTPAQFTEFIRREIDKWTRVVKAAGIKAD